MGANESQEVVVPWASPDPNKPYPSHMVHSIKQLSTTPQTFLKPHPDGDVSDFDMDTMMPALEGALKSDKKLSQWFPKLVPKRVSEHDFWKNYFSHVQFIRSTSATTTNSASKDDIKVLSNVSQSSGPSSNTSPLLTPTIPISQNTEVDIKDFRLSSPQNDAQPIAETTNSDSKVNSSTDSNLELKLSDNHIHDEALLSDFKHNNEYTTDHNHSLPEPDEESITSDYGLKPEPLIEFNDENLTPYIRWGIIGCGSVCEIKSGPAFQKAKNSKLVAVMRRTKELARDFAERHNVPKYYTTVEAIISDNEVDAIYIATPPGSHFEIAAQVCRAGKPCYVEKPMARNFEECRSMVKMFYSANVPLFVGYYRRRLDRFIAARQIVQRFLGNVTSVYSILSRNDHIHTRDLGWRVEPEKSGGGLFLDLGSHTLDILDFLLGPLERVVGDSSIHPSASPNTIVETNVTLTFRTQSGASGVATWDFCSAVYEDLLTINGTRGRLTMSIFGKDSPILHLPSGKLIEYEHTYPEHVHFPLVSNIVQALRGVSIPSDRLSTGKSAARTARVMDAALRSFYRSRNDEFWKRPHTWDNNTSTTGYNRT